MNSIAQFGGVSRRSAKDQENSQSRRMNETRCRAAALDQRTQNERARAVRAVKPPVADPLKEAKAILIDVLWHTPQHDEGCEARSFAQLNRCCPPAHPVWNLQPACNCWIGRLGEWLRNNPDI
jgi:hypothetical protein